MRGRYECSLHVSAIPKLLKVAFRRTDQVRDEEEDVLLLLQRLINLLNSFCDAQPPTS